MSAHYSGTHELDNFLLEKIESIDENDELLIFHEGMNIEYPFFYAYVRQKLHEYVDQMIDHNIAMETKFEQENSLRKRN